MMDEEDDKVKLISWNVNGLRAVVGKGFVDIFNALDADVSVFRRRSCRQDRLSLICRDMSSIGIMRKEKGIPEQQYLPVSSL